MSQKYVLVYTNGTYVTDDPLGDVSPGESTQLAQAFICDAKHAWQCMRKFDDIANALPVTFTTRLAKGQRPLG